jgi:hypothetical protein
MEASEGKVKKTFEELVPKKYHCHAKVFSKSESHRLPKHPPWDHTINLKPDAPETLKIKIYPMLINEQKTLDQFIQENLEKGYIVSSKSLMTSSVFFIKKKTSDLKLIQNYRKLNSITVKNHYLLLLSLDIITSYRMQKFSPSLIFVEATTTSKSKKAINERQPSSQIKVFSNLASYSSGSPTRPPRFRH